MDGWMDGCLKPSILHFDNSFMSGLRIGGGSRIRVESNWGGMADLFPRCGLRFSCHCNYPCAIPTHKPPWAYAPASFFLSALLCTSNLWPHSWLHERNFLPWFVVGVFCVPASEPHAPLFFYPSLCNHCVYFPPAISTCLAQVSSFCAFGAVYWRRKYQGSGA